MLNFPHEYGGQTVGFVSTIDGAPDRNNMPVQTHTVDLVSGVHFRPLRLSEKVGLADVATELWKLTAPPNPAVLAAEASGQIVYDGTDSPAFDEDNPSNVFQIVGGVQPFTDLRGQVVKVTVLCQRQT
ncbi:hypothetical protein SAMN04488581_2607 [Mycolicibacterium neoaurum]|nr:hypothetical protein SAMN04488581_2607 [Mycolicibacterium neoaurum]